jgi:uncharacterized RDD family membrane protein YckC
VRLSTDQTWITDLNSTNGTFINGRQIPSGREIQIDSSSNVTLARQVRLDWQVIESMRPEHPDSGPESKPKLASPAPSNMEPSAVYAGFWQRAVAYVIDSAILSVVYAVTFFVSALFLGLSGAGVGAGGMFLSILLFLGSLMVSALYHPLFECTDYQGSPGKYALSIKVTDMNGEKIDFLRAFGRNLAKLLSALPLYFGFLMASFTDRKQALHDMMADCLVVTEHSDNVFREG